MKKIIYLIIILSTTLLSCGTVCQELPTKVSYLRVGFPEHTDTYLRVEGSGRFGIAYNNLIQFKHSSCDNEFEGIATKITYFSVITEEEYNKSVGLTHSESIITDTIVSY
jgi:hypothetical protein